MGFLAVFKVRGSGLTNKTEVDVLEALAFFMNDQSGVCFPSTDAVARIARVHPNVARKTLKELEANGLISTRQAPGCRRYFDLHLDRLPLNETAGGNDLDGVKEVEPLKDVEGVKEVEVAPLKKVEGAPLTSLSTPLKDLEPELTKELTREQRRELTSLDAPERTLWETDQLSADVKKIEKPKKTVDRGSRLSITELPDDWKAFAEQEEPDLDPKRLFENFKDYWNGLSGAKAIKKDWKGTWRNFVRSFHNAEDWKRRPMLKRAPTHSPSRPGQFVEKKQSERDYFDW